MLTASQLFAQANGYKCDGKHECHWCLAPCKDTWRHDDPLPIPFQKSKSSAKRISSNYICRGCWMFRRPKITIVFNIGGLKDGQSPKDHSWLITPDQATGLRSLNPTIYKILLNPPLCFTLAIKDGNIPTLLHLAIVNQFEEIKADTVLQFTVNNIPHHYSVYELEHALREKRGVGTGTSPGTQALIRFFGHITPEELAQYVTPSGEQPVAIIPQEERGKGRPKKEERIDIKRKIS